jgi:H+/gluconate symporter-like permease
MAVLATRPGRGSFALARVASLVAAAALAVALLIGAAICLHVFAPGANGAVVRWVHDAGAWLTQPFHGAIQRSGGHRLTVNWGVAAAVYLVGGLVVARLLRAAAWRG